MDKYEWQMKKYECISVGIVVQIYMGYLVIYKKYQWQSKREYQRRESRRNLCMLEENNMEVTWKI